MPLEEVALPRAAGRAARRAGARSATPARTRAPRTRGASRTATSSAAFRGRFDHPPDVVARPRDEREVEARARVGAPTRASRSIPYGGGTSVVGGVTPARRRRRRVSLDLGALDRVLEVDDVSRAARDPGRRARARRSRTQLAEHGLTLRHFPQSFELSTLGGWIATRAGGHFATVETHIDDLVESVRAITPARACGSRGGCPARAPGPSPDRLLLGSRGDARRHHRGVGARAAAADVAPLGRRARSRRSRAGAEAVRALAQSGLRPSNCRLIDPTEARVHRRRRRVGARCSCSASSRPATTSARAFEQARRDRAASTAARSRSATDGGRRVGAWREAFLRAPYLRDTFVAMGVLSETFETAITWDRFAGVPRGGARRGARGGRASGALVSCRFTHVYPDGPAPYFTVLAPGAARRGGRAVGGDQGRGVGRAHRRRRHDHPPPRGRPRPPALVRPPAPRAVRRGAARGEGRGRPGRDPQPRRADRSVAARDLRTLACSVLP